MYTYIYQASLPGDLSEVVPVDGADVVSCVRHLLDVHHQSLLLREVHRLHALDERDLPLTLHHTTQQQYQQLLQLIQTAVCEEGAREERRERGRRVRGEWRKEREG